MVNSDLTSDKEEVGPAINFMGLTYAPINEQGVVLLFGMICEQLNIKVEAIRTGFPDAKVIDYREDPSRGTRKDVEFEFESSGFRRARHPVSKCDIIVCWKNDWKDCPTELEVIELRNAIRGLKGEEKIAEREISKPTPKAAQVKNQSSAKRLSGWEAHKRLLTSSEAVTKRIEEAKARGVSAKYLRFLGRLKRYWEIREDAQE